MKVNIHHKFKTIAGIINFLEADTINNLIKLARTDMQEYWELTIEDLDMLAFKNYKSRKDFFKLPNDGITIIQHFWYIGFLQFLENEFIKALDSLQIPNSLIKNYEKQAKNHLIKTSFIENMIIFVKNYFNLTSFEKASKVQLSELILAIKDKTNSEIFQRVTTELQIKQLKKKK